MAEEWFASWFDSRYYPILYQHRDYSEAEHFLRVLMGALQPPATARMLDLACGRGRHSVFLNRMGFDVTGVDLSPESISDAKAHENDRLHFHVRDMRLPFELGSFDYVLNLFTSFGYFQDKQDNLKVLGNIRSALSPDGQLVLDFFNVETVIRNLVKSESKTLNGIQFNIRRAHQDGFILKDIEVVDGGRSFLFQERVQALSLEDFRQLTDDAGLEIEKTWGNYDGAPWLPGETPRLILFCQHKRS